MRYAIYYSPPARDPLTRAASAWLGRCAFTGEAVAPADTGGLAADELVRLTAAARRYGFHATLMAPFALAAGESERSLAGGLAAFCERLRPFTVPRLAVGRLDGFLALVPETANAGLDRLARDVVMAFDRFRAPLGEAEMVRRGAAELSASQRDNLMRWGYPYVLEDFRFHMTLTDRVDEADAPRVRTAVEGHFGPLLDAPLEVASIGLFVEPGPGAPFTVRSLHRFGPASGD